MAVQGMHACDSTRQHAVNGACLGTARAHDTNLPLSKSCEWVGVTLLPCSPALAAAAPVLRHVGIVQAYHLPCACPHSCMHSGHLLCACMHTCSHAYRLCS